MRLSLICPINTLSYGYVSCYILRELHKKGIDISLHQLGQLQPEEKFVPDIQKALALQKWFDYDAPCIRIFHQNSMEQWVGDGERIAFPIFELNKFNEIEKHHLDFYNVDRILVCSKWAKSIVDEQIKYARCSVVPLGVDTDIFKYKENKRQNVVFFCAGKMEIRKSFTEVITSFKKCFPNNKDVELWLMWDNVFLSDEQKKYWIDQIKDDYRIKSIPRLNTHADVAYLMQQTSFGIFVSKAEGFNLELLEMLACGKTCIATNYSAHTEYANNENCLLIQPIGTEIAEDGIWFKQRFGDWCTFSIDDLCDRMLELYNNRDKYKINNAGIEKAKEFSWENSTNKLIDNIFS